MKWYAINAAGEMDGPWKRATSGDERYLYNGKEVVDNGSLRWHDYGARWYDPVVGRWGQVDPLAADLYGSFSPFNYVLNNPINAIDPSGAYELTGAAAQQWVSNRQVRDRGYYNSKGNEDSQDDIYPPEDYMGTFYFDEDGTFYRSHYLENWQWQSLTGEDLGTYIPGSEDTEDHSSSIGAKVTLGGTSDLMSLYNLKNAGYSYLAYRDFSAISTSSTFMGNLGRSVQGAGIALSLADFGLYLSGGGEFGLNANTLLFLGDVGTSILPASGGQGVILSASWQAGKQLGRYKNYLEIKNSPGGLDGLITSEK